MERLKNRYTGMIFLVAAMLYIHSYFILIHPLLFFVWPISLWFLIEIYKQWKYNAPRLMLFSLTFIMYLIATQLLVVENTGGIFFDLEPFPNMTAISYFVLLEVTVLYSYDALILRIVNYRNTPAYIGFASIIPWISPAIVEAAILIRWMLEGTFIARTFGKGLGAASLNDILFFYGFRNLLYSGALFYLVVGFLGLSELFKARRVNVEAKKFVDEINRDWHLNAWKNPISLLNDEDRLDFMNKYGELDESQQKELLRREVLPRKGINLVDPESF
jgi:hypothetical protein